MRTVAAILVAATVGTNAISTAETASAMKNPIRKVVTMLQQMAKKVEAEGEKEEELYKKYMCYCKTSGGDLQKSVAAAETKIPEVTAAIEAGAAQKKQLDADIVQAKADREDAKAAMAESFGLRKKQAAAYAEEKEGASANILAIDKAVTALEVGSAGSFLQTTAASTLRNVVQSGINMLDGDRQEMMSFLMAKEASEYSPQSGEIVGILKQLAEEMGGGLSESTAAEEASIKNHDELMAAKTKQMQACTGAIEDKTVRTGELAVEIVNMKDDLDDTQAALAEDQAFFADMEKNCATKDAEWEVVVKTRNQELAALADTIKILNDDDALELFKKTLPSAASSFVQMKVSAASMRSKALAAVRSAQKSSVATQPQLDLIALALHGKTVGFEKVVAMIDEMVELLKKEQIDDDDKKKYCSTEFDTTDDKKKVLERSISDSEAASAAAEDNLATLKSEIEALVAGIKACDKAVVEATEQRQEENDYYKELMVTDAAAVELLDFAKNRLNKFYNPKLYKPAAKRELSAEDKLVTAFGGTAAPTPAPGGISGTGIEALAQISLHSQDKVAPPPPPETFGAYTTKSQESNGVMAMIDMLIKDLDAEMQTAGADEKAAQSNYENMMSDSAAKRATDSKSVTEKEAATADTESALQAHNEDKDATTK